MKVNFEPFRDSLLVKRSKPAEFVGGVFVDTSSQSINEGEVLAVGEGRLSTDGKELLPLSVKVGDKVVFYPGAGFKLTSVVKTEDDDPEAEYLLLRESDIVGFRKE